MKIQFHKKTFFIIIAAVVIAITVFAVAGENGLIDVFKYEKERDAIAREKNSIEKENKELSEEVEFLKEDKRYIAAVAREELGMIGENEVIYKIEDE